LHKATSNMWNPGRLAVTRCQPPVDRGYFQVSFLPAHLAWIPIGPKSPNILCDFAPVGKV